MSMAATPAEGTARKPVYVIAGPDQAFSSGYKYDPSRERSPATKIAIVNRQLTI